MFQAEIHLRQEKPCVLDEFAERFDVSFDVAIEELHDHLVTFVIELDGVDEAYDAFFEAAGQVKHVERLDESSYLVTKISCGAYAAVDRNHGILRRKSVISPARRVYRVLFFRREDLRNIIGEFREVGTVTLGRVTEFGESTVGLTDRQHEVVKHALDSGYFEWPRAATSEELAAELGISRTTFLEHLRKGQAKLLSDALADDDRTEPPGLGARGASGD